MATTVRCIDPGVDFLLYGQELDLRYRVLREPLGMTREQVTFAGEAACLHVVGLDGEAVVGCVLFDWTTGRLRAMAVDPALQGQGVGAQLVRRLEAEVAARGVREVTLHARGNAVGFYARLGYAVRGEPFVEVGLPHRDMHKTF
jgi:ribosomal protein S18 acetylase RimI-like enzyme